MKLNEFIPEKSKNKKLIQAYIDEKTRAEVNKKRNKQGLSWDELIEALCRFYLADK